MKPTTKIITPWHNPEQCAAFCEAWKVRGDEDYLILQRDTDGEGCAVTKNKGIANARAQGAEVVVVLDDDCYPSGEARTLPQLAERHEMALEPQDLHLAIAVTTPPSRGTPYLERHVKTKVAASMGFWLVNGDFDAPSQLAFGPTHRMQFHRQLVHGRYFPLCGMNLAFRVQEWTPFCRFVDVPRFDDIWMGWIWERRAYDTGHCFNLNGPLVVHSRQSNVWTNLRQETPNLEANETLWRVIATHPSNDYASLRALLPVPDRGL